MKKEPWEIELDKHEKGFVESCDQEPQGITDEDREYASELLADLSSPDLSRAEIAARWFRKARLENHLLWSMKRRKPNG